MNLGTVELSNVLLGEDQIGAVYAGEDVIWENFVPSTTARSCSCSGSGETSSLTSGWKKFPYPIRNITSAYVKATINETTTSGYGYAYLLDEDGNSYKVATARVQGGPSIYTNTKYFTNTTGKVFTHMKCEWYGDSVYWASEMSVSMKISAYEQKGS